MPNGEFIRDALENNAIGADADKMYRRLSKLITSGVISTIRDTTDPSIMYHGAISIRPKDKDANEMLSNIQMLIASALDKSYDISVDLSDLPNTLENAMYKSIEEAVQSISQIVMSTSKNECNLSFFLPASHPEIQSYLDYAASHYSADQNIQYNVICTIPDIMETDETLDRILLSQKYNHAVGLYVSNGAHEYDHIPSQMAGYDLPVNACTVGCNIDLMQLPEEMKTEEKYLYRIATDILCMLDQLIETLEFTNNTIRDATLAYRPIILGFSNIPVLAEKYQIPVEQLVSRIRNMFVQASCDMATMSYSYPKYDWFKNHSELYLPETKNRLFFNFLGIGTQLLMLMDPFNWQPDELTINAEKRFIRNYFKSYEYDQTFIYPHTLSLSAAYDGKIDVYAGNMDLLDIVMRMNSAVMNNTMPEYDEIYTKLERKFYAMFETDDITVKELTETEPEAHQEMEPVFVQSLTDKDAATPVKTLEFAEATDESTEQPVNQTSQCGIIYRTTDDNIRAAFASGIVSEFVDDQEKSVYVIVDLTLNKRAIAEVLYIGSITEDELNQAKMFVDMIMSGMQMDAVNTTRKIMISNHLIVYSSFIEHLLITIGTALQDIEETNE